MDLVKRHPEYIIPLIIVLIAIGPMVTVWMINALTPWEIQLTLKTWFAALLLNVAFSKATSSG